ncbi:MAG: hypothetical protein KAR65_10130 [Anaerolineales bacterium]|nr:hypothetical protein [Anaerolineales bacterium]
MRSHTIRASEIAAFVFCQRAWWYSRFNLPPGNLESLTQGRRWHQDHGHRVILWRRVRTLGILSILIALAMAAITLASAPPG